MENEVNQASGTASGMQQNKYQELAKEICAMWKQKAAQVDSNIVYGSNSKVTITKSNKT